MERHWLVLFILVAIRLALAQRDAIDISSVPDSDASKITEKVETTSREPEPSSSVAPERHSIYLFKSPTSIKTRGKKPESSGEYALPWNAAHSSKDVSTPFPTTIDPTTIEGEWFQQEQQKTQHQEQLQQIPEYKPQEQERIPEQQQQQVPVQVQQQEQVPVQQYKPQEQERIPVQQQQQAPLQQYKPQEQERIPVQQQQQVPVQQYKPQEQERIPVQQQQQVPVQQYKPQEQEKLALQQQQQVPVIQYKPQEQEKLALQQQQQVPVIQYKPQEQEKLAIQQQQQIPVQQYKPQEQERIPIQQQQQVPVHQYKPQEQERIPVQQQQQVQHQQQIQQYLSQQKEQQQVQVPQQQQQIQQYLPQQKEQERIPSQQQQVQIPQQEQVTEYQPSQQVQVQTQQQEQQRVQLQEKQELEDQQKIEVQQQQKEPVQLYKPKEPIKPQPIQHQYQQRFQQQYQQQQQQIQQIQQDQRVQQQQLVQQQQQIQQQQRIQQQMQHHHQVQQQQRIQQQQQRIQQQQRQPLEQFSNIKQYKSTTVKTAPAQQSLKVPEVSNDVEPVRKVPFNSQMSEEERLKKADEALDQFFSDVMANLSVKMKIGMDEPAGEILDPVRLDDMQLQPLVAGEVFDVKMKQISVGGLSDYRITQLESQLNESRIKISIHYPKLTANCIFNANGSMYEIFKVHGKGNATIIFNEVHARTVLYLTKDNGVLQVSTADQPYVDFSSAEILFRDEDAAEDSEPVRAESVATQLGPLYFWVLTANAVDKIDYPLAVHFNNALKEFPLSDFLEGHIFRQRHLRIHVPTHPLPYAYVASDLAK